MKLIGSSIFFVVVTAIAAIAVNSQSNNFFGSGDLSAVSVKEPKSYIIQGATPEKLSQIVKSVGGNVSREFPIINAVSAILTPNQADEIRERGGVRVQDDRTVVTSSLASSTLTGIQKAWTIDNYLAQQTGADLVHDMGIKGSGVTVAVVDSGTNMWGNVGRYLFRDSSGKQRVAVKYDAFKGRTTYRYNDDQNGHGSHVSNIIASSLQDQNGNFNGIAPDVYLLSIKAFDKNGESSYSKVLDSLNWIFENRYRYKIRVVNMSLGAEVKSYYWQDPINQAVMRLWQAGVVVVTSAGNNGNDMGITVPGNNPYVLTVGAVTDGSTPHNVSDDRVASFSAKGPTYEGFIKPEVVTYGSHIATKLEQKYLMKTLKSNILGLDYAEVSGTSQAAAVVSGVAALVLSNDPYATPDEVKCRIMSTATPAATDTALTYSPFVQGTGLVNAYAAVMSTATNCGNKSLNIREDLLGINHFIGPAKVDNEGSYYIELSDGTVYTKGMHWGEGSMDLQGMHWGEGAMGLQGMHWGEGAMDLQGMHWGAGAMDVNGMHWGEGAMDLQGMHWGEGAMGLKGMHWGEGTMNLQGMHWGEGSMGIQGMHWGEGAMELESIDLDVDPIDPSVEVPIVEDVWL